VTVQNTLCIGNENCTGSITFEAFGGTPPYSYSINNGNTYQSNNIFNQLCSGTYTTVVRDSLNITYKETVVVSPNSLTENYIIYTNSISETTIPSTNNSVQNTEFEVIFNPPLSDGTFVALDLTIEYNIDNMGPWFNSNPNQTATYSFGTTLYKNGEDITSELIQSAITTLLSNRPNCSPSQISTSASTFTVSVIMGYGDTLTGTTLCQIMEVNPVSNASCVSTIESEIQIYASNARLTGCTKCAEIVNSQTPIIYTQTVVGTEVMQITQVISVDAATRPCIGGDLDNFLEWTIVLGGPATTDINYTLQIDISYQLGQGTDSFTVTGFVPQGMLQDPCNTEPCTCGGLQLNYAATVTGVCIISVDGEDPPELYC
jgi:hypothetical protein